MPEGPSIVILKELAAAFTGKKVLEAAGNAPIDLKRLQGKQVVAFQSWGKHFLICFKQFTVRIHLLLFGSYSINEQTKANPRLHLRFAKGDIYFYACQVTLLEALPDDLYDWSGDVMNENWSPRKARNKLKAAPDMLVCDALLNQHIFAGVGNIIKNEVLFRIRVHPESKVGALPAKQLSALIKEAVVYSFQFLEWKKENTLKRHWLAHTKKICPRCNIPFFKKHTGKTKRRSFFCTSCQQQFT